MITRSIFGDLSIYRLNDWIFYYFFVCLFEKNCNKCNQTFTIPLSYSRLTKASFSIGTVPLANSI